MTVFPEAQKRAQEDIDRVVGGHRRPDFDDRCHTWMHPFGRCWPEIFRPERFLTKDGELDTIKEVLVFGFERGHVLDR